MTETKSSNQLHHNESETLAQRDFHGIVLSEMCEPPSPENLQETINWLQELGLPPLPECPREADAQGKQPKQPNYLGRNGLVYSVNWKPWQTKNPPIQLLNQWFQVPIGIGTLAKFNGEHWITWVDIDQKNFGSDPDNAQILCDEAIANWEAEYPILKRCPMFRSPSGGYRYMIALIREPENFKSNSGFTLFQDSNKSCGELLAKNGGHTLLPPTIGLNGVYEWERFCKYPPVFDKPEDIGIYPLKKEEKSKPIRQSNQPELNNQTAPNINNKSNDLQPLIDEIDSRLDFETAFNWEEHNFNYEGDKVKGCCPWHESKSGTAFYAEKKNGKYVWRCPACDIGGNLISYRDRLNGGNGYPRGKEFINIVKGLCDEAGLEFPERRKIKNAARQSIEAHTTEESESNIVEINDVWHMATTPEETILKALFEDGEGNWIVIAQTFYKYSGNGYWKAVEDGQIEYLIAQALRNVYEIKKSGDKPQKIKKFATERNKVAAFKYCRSALSKKQELYNTHLVAFLNCTVDFRTGEQFPHSRDNFCFHAIAANYIPGADCPNYFKNFINDVFGEEFTELIRAITGMLLDPTAPYGYFPHLIGASGSGKGTLIRLWGSMLGEDAVRSLSSFKDITTPEQRHQYMTGARLVSLPDVGGFQGNLRAFYELVDNGAMAGRALFASSSYQRIWNCRFIAASVSLLGVENSGDGWDRRVIPLPTKRRQGKVDTDLSRKLQLEKGEIISWALGMDRAKRDELITNSATASDAIAKIKREQSIHSDSVKAFIDMCLRPNPHAGTSLQKASLHEYYIAYCRVHGYQASSYNKFISHIKEVLPQNFVDRKWRRSNGKREVVPEYFSHIEAVRGVFTSTNNLSGMPECLCNKIFCREGGLDEFEEFWQQGGTGFSGGTGLAQGNFEKPVPPENLTQQAIPGVAQVAQVLGEEINIRDDSTLAEGVRLSGNDDKIDGEKINQFEVEQFSQEKPVPPVPPSETPCKSSFLAGTGFLDQTCANPVPAHQTCANPVPPSDNDNREIAAGAITDLLQTPFATLKNIVQILAEMKISSIYELKAFMSESDFKKLEMLFIYEEGIAF